MWAEIDTDGVTDLKDLILNAKAAFEKAAIAYAIQLICQDNIVQEDDYFSNKRTIFKEEFNQYFRIGKQLMQYDSDQDGEASDAEKTDSIVDTRIVRV